MNINLSLVKTTALAFGVALLMIGVVLSLPGAPGAAQAAPSATIQSMIDAAPDGGTVSIPSGTYTESLTVNKTLTLTGVSSATTIIQAITGQRVITVTSGHNLRLENLTVTGGHPSGTVGGGIFAAGNLQIVNCRIANNSADYGGGVFQEDASGRVDVIGSRIELNTTGNHGGGLYVSGSAALTNTLVLSNTAGWHGGGLHVNSGRTDLNGGLFSNNQAMGDNGGAVNVNNSISVTGTQFISNAANDSGGALLQWNAGYTVTVTYAHFERNTAKNYGGALWARGNTTLSGSVFQNNTCTGGNCYGGGLYADNSLTLTGTQFISNTAANGGGLAQWNTGYTVTVTDARFERNMARSMGGGAFVSGTLTISNSNFVSNTADSGSSGDALGGGLYASGASQLFATSFVGNSVLCSGASCGDLNGGGLYINGTRSTLAQVTFVDNQTVRMGGGIMSVGSDLTLNGGVFSGNQAGWGGGLYHDGGNLVLTNALFSGNLAGWGGGMGQEYGTALMTHVTFGGNRAVNIGGGLDNFVSNPTLVNCIFWGNSAPTGPQIGNEYGSTPAITYSDIQGTSIYTGEGNINADPQFIAPIAAAVAPTTTGNYHLGAGSPAINAGVDPATLGVPLATDYKGNARPQGAGYDIGAYEFVVAP